MRAITWAGPNRVTCEETPDPAIVNPRDAILKVTATTICGSDLHLCDGYVPAMQRGDILGARVHRRGRGGGRWGEGEAPSRRPRVRCRR
jgi:threonine dehydrogenase-like Zn-dependent dehydrogenase